MGCKIQPVGTRRGTRRSQPWSQRKKKQTPYKFDASKYRALFGGGMGAVVAPLHVPANAKRSIVVKGVVVIGSERVR